MTKPMHSDGEQQEDCTCILSGYAQTTNYCPVHTGQPMTHTTPELPEELREKVKRLIKANVKYLVSDPNDPRVGILAQDQMEGFIFNWMKQELSTQAHKQIKEIEKMKIDPVGDIDEASKKYFHAFFELEGHYGYNQALEDVIDKIKKGLV